MGVHQREGGVVADRADVAEVVGEPLELGHQRAQPRARAAAPRCRAPPRRRGRRRAHRRPCCRPRCGRQAWRARVEIGAGHQALDALVHIAEALLQAHHRLAVGGEAEMPGLDDAGMHRADRDLVQALALGRQEGVGRRRRPALRSRAPSGCAHAPAAVVEPGPRIGQPLGLRPNRSRDRALQPDRRRHGARPTEGKWPSGQARLSTRDLGRRLVEQRHVHASAPRPTGRAASSGPRRAASPAQLQVVGVDHGARPGPVVRDAARLRGSGLVSAGMAPSPQPSSAATCWNQATSGGGR